MDTKPLSNFMNQFEEVTKKPEKFISLQEEKAESIKLLMKDLYNFAKGKENSESKNSEVLEELIITDLDEEQIWQQVELQNSLIYNSLVHDVAHLLAKKDNLRFPLKVKQKKKLCLNGSNKKNDLEKDIIEEKKMSGQSKAEKKNKCLMQKSSVVDDKFFKLHEMEEFLERVEKGKEAISDDDDDVEIDYFEDDKFSDDNNDNEEEQLHYNDFFDQPDGEESSTASKKVKFNFKNQEKKNNDDDDNDDNDNDDDDDDNDDNDNDDDIDDDDDDVIDYNSEKEEEESQKNLNELKMDNSCEEDDNENSNINEAKQNVSANSDDDSTANEFNNVYDNNDSEDDDDESDKNQTKQQSTFEARQERLKLRIKNLEEEALMEKPWQLKGEVTGKSRPQNSLLEEYVEFDIATRPAPVLTEKSTIKLEDVIIQRIKDKAWDDVVRKFKPVENDIEYKKKLVLDQEKSKLSLAQIYEKEYLKQLESKNENDAEKPEIEPPEYQEIRSMMNNLFNKLDALSNFHFTPKQVQPEVKIISNLPAINMEEVAPVAISDANLLAPEEVKPKLKGDLIGKSERTATDKKRERRQKKLKQKLKYKQMEAKAKLKLEKLDSKDTNNKKISQKLLQKIVKSNNITQLDENKDCKYIKSSNSFFSKLQTKTDNKIKKQSTDLKKLKSGKGKRAKISKAR